MDRGAWQATVHRVAQSQTPLKRLSSKQQQVQPRKWELLKLPKLLFVVVVVEVELIYTVVFQVYSKVIQLYVCMCVCVYITYAYILFQIFFHYRQL